MSYLKFDKDQLTNLEYSLNKEYLRTNRAGAFASSTIVNCHIRKYHGLLISPIDELGGQHVLLSALDETIIQHEREFHLAVRKYPNHYHPGHKYQREFIAEPIPTIIYRVGGVILKKEMLLAQEEDTILIRYTLEDMHSPTKILFHPFLAFRNIHTLSKENLDVNKKCIKVKNGVRTKMYEAYPNLYMQFNKKTEWVPAPMWFNNVEYTKEQERGYEFQEDLYVPGYFEATVKKGDVLVFSASLKEQTPGSLKRKFDSEINKRVPRDSFENCLKNSAQQFIINRNKQTLVVAGYPFFTITARDTFIALPGLALAEDKPETIYEEVLDTISKTLQEQLFFKIGNDTELSMADTPLWYIWAIQQYYLQSEKQDAAALWKKYGKNIRTIIDGIKNSAAPNTWLHDNGLIYTQKNDKGMTWMDWSPVPSREGYAVEINALWYNAVCFALEIAQEVKSNKFTSDWKEMPELIEKSFNETFWNAGQNYLADVVRGDYKDWRVRPNQIFAASLPYSPINDDIKKAVVDRVKSELVTPKGLRTLSPKNEEYKPTCDGPIRSKNLAYHQGTVWPSLIAHFTEAFLSLYQRSGISFINEIYKGFEDEMFTHGIATIAEMYDGNPPHRARGTISQAASVAEVLRMKQLIDKYNKR